MTGPVTPGTQLKTTPLPPVPDALAPLPPVPVDTELLPPVPVVTVPFPPTPVGGGTAHVLVSASQQTLLVQTSPVAQLDETSQRHPSDPITQKVAFPPKFSPVPPALTVVPPLPLVPLALPPFEPPPALEGEPDPFVESLLEQAFDKATSPTTNK